MIRSKTTFVIGGGASAELQLPTSAELLARISQAVDFSRTGTDLQTRDGFLLAQYFSKLGARAGKRDDVVGEAAERIRIACKLSASIENVLEQYSDDQLIAACGKLAMTHFICQGEARSILRTTPRVVGDLPVQGTDNWLYQFAQLLTSGVSKAGIAKSFDNFNIVYYGYDRSIEHFLPFALSMAYGMALKEAQQIVGQKLHLIRPYGSVGRLPWQSGEAADIEWGTEQPWNVHNLSMQIKTPSEARRDQTMLRQIRAAVAEAKRIVFLGFGFQAQDMEFLFDYSLSHDPELVLSMQDVSPLMKTMVTRMLKRKAGIEDDELMLLSNLKPYELLREFSLLLES